MTEFKIRVKHERYSDDDYYTPNVTVDNLLVIEDFEHEFLNALCKFVSEYWERKEKEQ